jgi:DNA modification methylase
VSKSTELEKPLIYGEKNLKSAWNFNGVFLETSVANTNALKKQLDANRVIMTHPAVMNEVVAEVLIKTFSPVGGLVADVFCGINTTGIKCAQLGREFVGYEINKSFFQQGVERTKLLYCDNKNETLRSII